MEDALPEHPERPIERLLEDLEQQASGLHLAERDAEVADRAQAEYARVELAGRVLASVGRRASLALVSGQRIAGEVSQAGADWLVLLSDRPRGQLWVVRTAGIETVEGLSARALAPAARPVTARLSFGSAVRRIAGSGPVLLVHLGGSHREVVVNRVGADFLEAVPAGDGRDEPGAGALVVPFAGLVALRTC